MDVLYYANVSAGGPIRRDKLWFFAGGWRRRQQQHRRGQLLSRRKPGDLRPAGHQLHAPADLAAQPEEQADHPHGLGEEDPGPRIHLGDRRRDRIVGPGSGAQVHGLRQVDLHADQQSPARDRILRGRERPGSPVSPGDQAGSGHAGVVRVGGPSRSGLRHDDDVADDPGADRKGSYSVVLILGAVVRRGRAHRQDGRAMGLRVVQAAAVRQQRRPHPTLPGRRSPTR